MKKDFSGLYKTEVKRKTKIRLNKNKVIKNIEYNTIPLQFKFNIDMDIIDFETLNIILKSNFMKFKIENTVDFTYEYIINVVSTKDNIHNFVKLHGELFRLGNDKIKQLTKENNYGNN